MLELWVSLEDPPCVLPAASQLLAVGFRQLHHLALYHHSPQQPVPPPSAKRETPEQAKVTILVGS